jgi:hypothetical protein
LCWRMGLPTTFRLAGGIDLRYLLDLKVDLMSFRWQRYCGVINSKVA